MVLYMYYTHHLVILIILFYVNILICRRKRPECKKKCKLETNTSILKVALCCYSALEVDFDMLNSELITLYFTSVDLKFIL